MEWPLNLSQFNFKHCFSKLSKALSNICWADLKEDILPVNYRNHQELQVSGLWLEFQITGRGSDKLEVQVFLRTWMCSRDFLLTAFSFLFLSKKAWRWTYWFRRKQTGQASVSQATVTPLEKALGKEPQGLSSWLEGGVTSCMFTRILIANLSL